MTVLVLMDLRKAFDVIDHDILQKCYLFTMQAPLLLFGLNRIYLAEGSFITLYKATCVPRFNLRTGAFPFVRQRHASLRSQVNHGHFKMRTIPPCLQV